MDEESLRNRLVSRLKEQRQIHLPHLTSGKDDSKDKLEHKTSDPEFKLSEKAKNASKCIQMQLSNAFDSEISSGEMTESTKGNDEIVKRIEHKRQKKELKTRKKGKKENSKERNRNYKKVERKVIIHDVKEGNSAKKIECKKERDHMKTSLEGKVKRNRSLEKQHISSKKRDHSRTPSHQRRSRYRRDSISPRKSTRDRERRLHSLSRSRGYERRRDRSRSPTRRRVSPEHHSRNRRESKRVGGGRDSRDWRRRCYPRSRSTSRCRSSRSDSTTSFSISSYGSDLDTLSAEKNVAPATSTTNPPGFGQGLYIPLATKSGMGDLLLSIKQGQTEQQKDSVIAKYTAICQKISAREGEHGAVSEAHVSTSGDYLQSDSKFKRVEEEFPCSHGSEHRKAAFDSEIGTTLEEPRPFTDPTSINKMLLGIKPGQFTGDKATLLPFHLLEGGDPAWAKKNQFKRLAPIGDGFGRKLMEKMGWREGMPLGMSGHGVMTPLELDVKTDRKGLGVGSNRDPLFLPPPPAPYPPFQISHPVSTAAVAPVPAASRLVEPNMLAGGKHPVCVLMEICAKKRWDPPVFEEVGEQGIKSFKFKVSIPIGCYQPLQPSINKKEAKKQAALACLQALGQVPSKPNDFVTTSIPLVRPVIHTPQPLLNIPPPPCPMPPHCQMPMINTGHVFTPPILLRNPTILPSHFRPPLAVHQMPFIQQPYSDNNSNLNLF